jgi:hypothetical protein
LIPNTPPYHVKKKRTALKRHCLIYVACLQKKPVYILPSLGFKLIFLIAYVIVGTFYYTSNVARMGKYASVFVATFLIDVGKDLVRDV